MVFLGVGNWVIVEMSERKEGSGMRKYWDRKEGTYITENSPSEEKLKFLYTTTLGRVLLKAIFSRRWFSFLGGIYYRSPFSKKKIKKVIDLERKTGLKAKGDKNLDNKPGDTGEICRYKNFNQYFSRQEVRTSQAIKGELISPADSRLLVYEIDEDLTIPVKNTRYAIGELLGEKEGTDFALGYCLVYRLTLGDYHRYSYIDNGTLEKSWKIKGRLNTVRPIKGSKEVYFRNAREVTIMETENFGKVTQVEIGAMLVGKICNYKTSGLVSFMEEKGRFEYGGSTIVQLFAKGSIKIDEDIMEMSTSGIETKVSVGEKVGRCLNG